MPANKRPRRERTDDWQKIRQYTLWPEQKVYELLRPVVLFNESATERARETGAAERSVRRRASQFEEHGMASLFEQAPKEDAEDKSRSLPPDMRQLIVDLKAEHPDFRPNEMATICFLRFGRRPSSHTIQRVLADGPLPSIAARRFPPYAQIAEPFERRKVVVILHAEGWSVSTIAAYMPVSVFLTKRYDVPDNCEMCAQSSVESRYATRCSATMVFPVPGPPLINSNAGGAVDQGTSEAGRHKPPPFRVTTARSAAGLAEPLWQLAEQILLI